MKVSYAGSIGIQSPSNKLDLLSAADYNSVLNTFIDGGPRVAAILYWKGGFKQGGRKLHQVTRAGRNSGLGLTSDFLVDYAANPFKEDQKMMLGNEGMKATMRAYIEK